MQQNASYRIARSLGLVLAAALAAWAEAAGDIPSEAQRHMIRGRAAIEMAKSPEEYRFAIEEFEKAVKLAPHWAEAYYNLGMVQAELGELPQAIANLKRYLELAPNAPDAAKVREEVIRLEYRLEREQRLTQLAGDWIEIPPAKRPWILEQEGKRLVLHRSLDEPLMGRIDVVFEALGGFSPFESFGKGTYAERFELELSGLELQGSYVRAPFVETKSGCTVPEQRSPARGRLDPAAGLIELRYRIEKHRVRYSDPFPGLKRCLEVVSVSSEDRSLKIQRATPQAERSSKTLPAGHAPGTVGLRLGVLEGQFRVVEVLSGSPAARAGLQPGDRLIAVEDRPVDGSTLEELVARIRGVPGTTVSVTIEREGWETPRVFRLTREAMPPATTSP